MRRFAHALAIIAALALVTTACGGSEDSGLPSTNPTSTPADHVTIVDSAFEPKTFQILVNTEARWVQTGSLPHSVTADDGSFTSHLACSASDTSQCMKTGDEFKHLFTKAGTYPYYCVIHGGKGGAGMSGLIIVT
jgi:plastocyanin